MSRYGLPTLEATFLAVCRAQGVPVTVRDDEQPVLADEKSRLAAAEAAGVAASAGSVQVSEDTPLITAAPSPPRQARVDGGCATAAARVVLCRVPADSAAPAQDIRCDAAWVHATAAHVGAAGV